MMIRGLGSLLRALIGVVLGTASVASNAPTLEGPWPLGPFDSELEAVRAAANHFNPRSLAEDREYLGAVLRQGDRFTFTVSPGQRGRDRITATIRIPAGFDLTAFWHTHGATGTSRQFFSEMDTRLAEDWNRPLYLADFTGELKAFRPGDPTLPPMQARRMGLPGKHGYAVGIRVRDAWGDTVRVRTDARLPERSIQTRFDHRRSGSS